MHEILPVSLGKRSYNIVIGEDIIGCAAEYILDVVSSRRVAIISDKTVAGLYVNRLSSVLRVHEIDFSIQLFDAGESTKSWDNVACIMEWLLRENYERNDTIIALGGGVIGDLAGFAASIFRRGINYVQIPTSLLAQVDSAIGGKTGINTSCGKNLVGAFYQPRLVLSDISVLNSLPSRDFLSGYGEVVKYGLIADYDFFAWCETNGSALLAGDSNARIRAIKRSCQIKADIVAQDEHDKGKRAYLNLGHTFGHALETATGYSGTLLHGEAVAIGCVLAANLSSRLGLCSQEIAARIRTHLKEMGMKYSLQQIEADLPDADGLMALMKQDKKVRDGAIHFVLLTEIGQAVSYAGVEDAFLRDFLREMLVNDA